MRLSIRFFLLLTLSFLILAGVVFGGFELQKGELIEYEEQHIDQQTELASEQVNNQITEKKSHTQATASESRVTEFGSDAQRLALVELYNEDNFRGVSIIDSDGDLVDYYGEGADEYTDSTDDYSDREYFQPAIAGETFINDPREVELAGGAVQQLFMIATPIYDDGEIIGILRSTINLDDDSEIFQLIRELPTDDGYQSVKVADSTGETIYTDSKTIEDPVVSTYSMDTTGWTVALESDEGQIAESVRPIVYLQGIAMLSIILVIGGMGTWVYNRHVRQIHRLETAFRRLGNGEFHHKVDLGGGREWNSIGQQFNRLASRLEARERELETERDHFAALFRNLPIPAVEVAYRDDEPRINRTNNHFCQLFSDDAAERSLDEIVDADERTAELFAEITAGNQRTETLELATKEGSRECIVHVAPSRIHDESEVGFVLFTDISEQQRLRRYLEVLNRVLRHDLRTGVKIIEGHATLL